MDDKVAPCVQDAEVEGFRHNLESNEAREDFYQPITHPFPPDPEPDPLLKGGEEPEPSSDVVPIRGSASPPSLPSLHGDAAAIDEQTMEAEAEAEAKRSISQEIIDMAYRTAMEANLDTLAAIGVREEPPPSSEVELDVIKDASTKSLFGNLITSPSRVSSRMSRRDSNNAPSGTDADEVTEDRGRIASKRSVEAASTARPRYYSNRATTLPAKLEIKASAEVTSRHAKLTRWEVFKRKFYLGVAHNLQPPSRGIEDTAGISLDAETPRASTAGHVDTESFCEVTNIEGLDLEGIPPMTQRSRKLFSWTRLKTGFPFKRKGQAGGGKGKISDEPKGEPDEAAAATQNNNNVHDDEDDDDGIGSQLDENEVTTTSKTLPASTPATPTKDKTHSWFEILSHRLFTATRRQQRTVENGPPRPATANTQQYYEIESNW